MTNLANCSKLETYTFVKSIYKIIIKNKIFQARGGIEQDVLEAYCWMYSTWNIPKEYKGACSGGDQVATSRQSTDHVKTKTSLIRFSLYLWVGGGGDLNETKGRWFPSFE